MTRKEEIDKEIKSIDNSYCTVTSACEAAIEWADRTMIEKATKWIIENLPSSSGISAMMYADDFKKAMEN